MRKICILLVLLLVAVCPGKSTVNVPTIEGDILHTIQTRWVIAESENSADTQTNALSSTERTKLIVDRLIVANAANEEFISTFRIPSKWNAMRFRGIGLTDNGTLTHQIYLGTLGGDIDCSLTFAGQLAWTIGPQTSSYYFIGFLDGGTYVPLPGDIVTGNTSEETAIIESVTLTSGAWASANAAGTLVYRARTGTFTNSETVTLSRGSRTLTADAYQHTASDVLAFELADTLVVTDGSWGASWATTSPVDNDTHAETEIEVKGSDYMVIVTTTCSNDGKLLVTGY